MIDDQDLFDDDTSATQILQALISPAPAQALVASPPDTPPPTKPGESTPLTGSLRSAPSQATPKRLPEPGESRGKATPAGHSLPSIPSLAKQTLSGPKIRRGLARYFSSGSGTTANHGNLELASSLEKQGSSASEAWSARRSGLRAPGRAPAKTGALSSVAPETGVRRPPGALGPALEVGWKGAAAARADARDPILRRQIIAATDQPQPIGATELRFGRRITQPSDNPAVNQALATDAMDEYRANLAATVKQIPGAKLAASRSAKNPRRLAEKIALEGQPAETVSDYGAAQISVASPQARDAVIAAIKKRFPVLRVEDNFAQGDPEYGYRSYSMQLQMPNGASQELQIVPKEVFEVNRVEHKKYKTARDAKLAGKSASASEAAAERQNGAAMAKFNLRNLAGNAAAATKPGAAAMDALRRGSTLELRKGSAVALPDGTRGTILYLDPNMKIARVRTTAGKNLTLRRQDLRALAVQDSNGQGDNRF